MDHQWRPIPSPHPTFCPFCSFSHFPFCPPPPPPPPPPPYHQNPRFPPPQQPPPPPPPPPYLDYPRPHPDPNFNYREEFAQPMYDYYNNAVAAAAASTATTNGYMSEADMRKYKRPRVDDFGYNGLFLSDDERRLKLIRDHGSGNFDDNRLVDGSNLYSPFRPTQELHRPYDSSGSNNNWQNHGMPNYAAARPDYQRPADQRGYMSENNWVFSGVTRPPPPPRPSPPPLPASPPPPLPMEPVMQPSPPKTSSLFPLTVSSSISNPYLQSKSTGFVSEGWQQSSGQTFFPKQLSTERATMVDASHLFKQPHRATRANHIVIILRGLPGSGKSYLAKMMRDLEVENGGDAPRIHSMDDYFMTEVEKFEESDASKSSSSTRGKKPTVKKVMEYCYESEMEEAYRDSMLKAFKKTLEEGIFTLVIVDDRNLRVADFAQFWAIAKRSGYEVYISEATYKDPTGCAARNVHGFTLDEIRSMAKQWEEAPSLYVQLDIKSLFRGDDLKQSGIQEVDMDAEDEHFGEKGKPEKTIAPPVVDDAPHVCSEDGNKWYAEEDHPMRVKELGKSKWSNDLDEDDTKGSGGMRVNNALSGLIQAYRKQGKSVRWSDQVVNTGFSIGAAKRANMPSLVIGPGAGYNLKSNPLAEEECPVSNQSIGNSRQRIFQERLRKEQESFKAVFDRRKHRIGGLDFEEE